MAVFSRAMRLLQVYASFDADSLSLTALSAHTGLPLTTVHRLCAQLVDEGILERTPDGEYAVGLRLWQLGHLPSRARNLRDRALKHLQDLYEVTREDVQLSILEDFEVIIVERMSRTSHDAATPRVGSRQPAHATSDGIVILAHQAPDLLDEFAERELPRFTPQTIGDAAGLLSAAARARRQGWIELRGHLAPGQISIAAPIRSRAGVVAAVSLTFERPERVNAYLPAVAVTARRIGAALGAT